MCVGKFEPLMLINWICHTKSESDLFLYTKNLKPIFEYKIFFWICVLVLWILKGYCVVKKLEWSVRNKLSGIQIILYKGFALKNING